VTVQPGAATTRRARPLLGTLVEVGVCRDHPGAAAEAAFGEIARLQALLSRFDAGSDIARFNALPSGASIAVDIATREVLACARRLADETAGAFDITLGSGPDGWHVDAQGRLHKLAAQARLDLGGIAKGYIVDRAVQMLREQGATAGWVNAGGDLRAFGAVEVPVLLRDEPNGGARPFAQLADGAFATSHYGPETRSQLAAPFALRHRTAGGVSGVPESARHVSVAAPNCLHADALTKIIALSGDTSHPLLARYGAQAWLH